MANGLQASGSDGVLASAVPITDHELVLARSVPPGVETGIVGPDGLLRRAVANNELTRLVGVTTLASFRDARVRLLRRDGGQCQVDYVGGDHAEAARLGFRQLGQSEWEARWVLAEEVTHRTRLERDYPQPRPAEVLSGVS